MGAGTLQQLARSGLMTPHVEMPVQAKEATETPVGNGEAMPKTAPPSAPRAHGQRPTAMSTKAGLPLSKPQDAPFGEVLTARNADVITLILKLN